MRTTARNKEGTDYLLLLLTALFSIYVSLLLIAMNGRIGGYSWAIAARSFYVGHYSPTRLSTPLPLDDNSGIYFAAFLLLWTMAVLIFIITMFLARLSLTKRPFLALVGILSVCGLGLLPLLASHWGLLFLDIETLVSVIFVLLFAYKGWPRSTALRLILLIAHFVLWSWGFWKGPATAWVLWPFWHWAYYLDHWVDVIYPLLGLTSTTIWGVYVSRLRRPSLD